MAVEKFGLLMILQLTLLQFSSINCGSVLFPTEIGTSLLRKPPELIKENRKQTNDALALDVTKEVEATEIERQAIDQEAVWKTKSESLLTRVGIGIKAVLAPAQSYGSLLARYHRWFSRYKKMEQIFEPGNIRSASEVFQESYAKADQLYLSEQCRLGLNPNDVSKLETVDFVFNSLSKAIVELESIVANLEKSEQTAVIDYSGKQKDLQTDENVYFDSVERFEHENEFDVKRVTDDGDVVFHDAQEDFSEEQIKVSLERVKRIAVKTAKNMIANELFAVARLAVLNATATYMANNELPDSLSLLTRVICLIGSANTPLAIDYFRSLEFRAALAVISRIGSFSRCRLHLNRSTS